MLNLYKLLDKPHLVGLTLIVVFTVFWALVAINIIPPFPYRYSFTIALVIFFYLILYLLKQYMVIYKSEKWLRATAEITECRIIENKYDNATLYIPFVAYRYTVGKNDYISNSIKPFDIYVGSEYKTLSRRIIDKFHVKQVLNVYYNPLEPSESCIEKKGSAPLLILMIFLSIMFILTLLFVSGILY